MIYRSDLKEKLKEGVPCLGTWVTLPSVEMIEIAALSGFDFVVIDTEHGPIGLEKAQAMLIAAERHGLTAIFRVPVISREHILGPLELGMHGIQVPNISKVKDLNDLMSFSSYSPNGIRGFSPFNRGAMYHTSNVGRKIASDRELIRVIHIEGKDGIENIDSLLSHSGIDVFFLGLYDLSVYLGAPGNFTNKSFVNLFENLSQKILKSGKVLGSIASSKEQLKSLKESGVRYITYAADCEIVSNAYRDINNTFREML